MNNPNPNTKAFSIRTSDGITADQIDDLSYVDTNFLLDLNNKNSKHHSYCTDFVALMEENDKFIAYSSWVENELSRILRLQYARTYYKIDRISDIDKLPLTDRQLINQTAFSEAEQLISSLDHMSLNVGSPSSSANEEAKNISIQSGMQFDDSLHISVGLENGINSYITSDGGFLDFRNGKNNINIYGASQTISDLYKKEPDKNRLKFEF
ncbi:MULTISPECIES: type II toxin-antitoxin system VapC family toxin [Jeotgalicoccus]|uniref:type II toxin-antitoxin system VapC family toxin n=1 Tax=Jeotgalicoccus TaxID=227979 RepID=UPI000427C26D|nr:MULTISPECIES: type II toxin-antitoxin system VapC family toxin [Jeotgalicoccus]